MFWASLSAPNAFPPDLLLPFPRQYELPLFAVESKRSLADFDALGFSQAYELGATNILEMLELAGIPLSWKERQQSSDGKWDVEGGSWPLIFAGESLEGFVCIVRCCYY